MSAPEVQIISYFSIETDLAESFREWPEFIEGKDYDVVLKSVSGEGVSIRFVSESVAGDENEKPYVSVKSNYNGELFQRALGLTTYLLSAHSDNLMINRWS